MSGVSGIIKGTRSSRLRTGYPRQWPNEGETAEYVKVRDTPHGAVPTVTSKAISIPDMRKPPSGKCQYDPKSDMRSEFDAYQDKYMGENKHINVELTNTM